jgi:hypothetical protein
VISRVDQSWENASKAGCFLRSSVRLYKEDEEEERGVGGGEEFECACKRRRGGGSDLNFYLLLQHLSSCISARLSPISLCLLPSLPTQPDERRRNEEGERMYFPPPFPFPLAFCTLPWCIITGVVPALSITA